MTRITALRTVSEFGKKILKNNAETGILERLQLRGSSPRRVPGAGAVWRRGRPPSSAASPRPRRRPGPAGLRPGPGGAVGGGGRAAAPALRGGARPAAGARGPPPPPLPQGRGGPAAALRRSPPQCAEGRRGERRAEEGAGPGGGLGGLCGGSALGPGGLRAVCEARWRRGGGLLELPSCGLLLW